MPLARILSRSPEHATALMQELERYGYEVEVLHPEQASIRPADVEIQYELCDTAQVLERAQQMASEAHADVAVEPGALTLSPAQPQADRREELHVEEYEEQLQQVTFSQAPEDVAPALQSVEQPWFAESAVEPNGIERPTFEPQNLENVEAVRADALHAWARRANLLLAATANGLEKLRGFTVAALHKIREQRERSAIHSAEARARREQELLELTCRRAEAERRSQQLEAARRAAAEYLVELRSDASAYQQAASGTSSFSVTSFVRESYSRVREITSQHVKAIAAGAAATGALFALTLGISTFRSRPDAPKTTAPAAAQTPLVNVHSGTPLPAAQTTRPSPSVRADTRKPTRSSLHSHAASRPAQTADDEQIADDVVVRHFAPKAPARALQSRRMSGGIKRYSDTDN